MLESLIGYSLTESQREVLDNIKSNNFSVLVTSRDFGRNHLLAFYIIEKSILAKNNTIVIASSGYRSATAFLAHLESILHKSIIKYTSRHNTDYAEVVIGDNSIKVMPIRDGTRIKGVRPSDLILIEASTINMESCMGASAVGTKIIMCDYEEYTTDDFNRRLTEWENNPESNFYLYRNES